MLTRVPCRQEMCNVPPSAVTRSRIPVRPNPCCPEPGGKIVTVVFNNQHQPSHPAASLAG